MPFINIGVHPVFYPILIVEDKGPAATLNTRK